MSKKQKPFVIDLLEQDRMFGGHWMSKTPTLVYVAPDSLRTRRKDGPAKQKMLEQIQQRREARARRRARRQA